jgi:hypothetical protein
LGPSSPARKRAVTRRRNIGRRPLNNIRASRNSGTIAVDNRSGG